MAISETQLETWAKQGPSAQFTSTYDTLSAILNDSSSPYYLKAFKVFLQGSYKNDTNVYGDSDVDVVIRLDEIFYTDLNFLSDDEKRRHEAQRTPGSYSLSDFTAYVVSWLTKKYGNDVQRGSKAVFIRASGARRNADILVCAKLRRYYSFPQYGEPAYVDGICFWPSYGGDRIENFPEQHSENCTSKHQDTKKWFKHTARIFKNLRNSMIEKSIIREGLAPSYFIEGMLYNVPTLRFGGNEQLNLKDVLEWLLVARREDFVCANEQFKLLGHGNVTWPPENCTAFLNAAKKHSDSL